jgi:hypothetical protein
MQKNGGYVQAKFIGVYIFPKFPRLLPLHGIPVRILCILWMALYRITVVSLRHTLGFRVILWKVQ